MSDYSKLQSRCQLGKASLAGANNLLAECHAALGQLMAQNARSTVREISQLAEIEVLRKALNDCADSLHSEMLQKFGGQLPEDMHPVTRREYDRDMAEVARYRAAMGKGEQP